MIAVILNIWDFSTFGLQNLGCAQCPIIEYCLDRTVIATGYGRTGAKSCTRKLQFLDQVVHQWSQWYHLDT